MNKVAAEVEKMIAEIEQYNRRYTVETHWSPAECREDAERRFARSNPALYQLWLEGKDA